MYIQMSRQASISMVLVGEGIEKLGHGVVRLDLDGVFVEGQPQGLDEAAVEALPVQSGQADRWAL